MNWSGWKPKRQPRCISTSPWLPAPLPIGCRNERRARAEGAGRGDRREAETGLGRRRRHRFRCKLAGIGQAQAGGRAERNDPGVGRQHHAQQRARRRYAAPLSRAMADSLIASGRLPATHGVRIYVYDSLSQRFRLDPALFPARLFPARDRGGAGGRPVHRAWHQPGQLHQYRRRDAGRDRAVPHRPSHDADPVDHAASAPGQYQWGDELASGAAPQCGRVGHRGGRYGLSGLPRRREAEWPLQRRWHPREHRYRLRALRGDAECVVGRQFAGCRHRALALAAAAGGPADDRQWRFPDVDQHGGRAGQLHVERDDRLQQGHDDLRQSAQAVLAERRGQRRGADVDRPGGGCHEVPPVPAGQAGDRLRAGVARHGRLQHQLGPPVPAGHGGIAGGHRERGDRRRQHRADQRLWLDRAETVRAARRHHRPEPAPVHRQRHNAGRDQGVLRRSDESGARRDAEALRGLAGPGGRGGGTSLATFSIACSLKREALIAAREKARDGARFSPSVPGGRYRSIACNRSRCFFQNDAELSEIPILYGDMDGAYLAELLLSKGYVVHGVKRRSSSFNTGRIEGIYQDPHAEGNAADRNLQPGRAKPCHGEFRDARIYGQCRWYRHAAPARGDSHPGHGKDHPFLSGIDVGTVRSGAGSAAAGDDAVLSPLALCRGQALRLLDRGQLPRGLWHARLERHPVQPREPAARRDLRDAQDHAGGGGDPAGAPGEAVAGQSRCPPRLGPRARIRARHVADAAAGTARRLRARHGRDDAGPHLCRMGVRGCGHHAALGRRRRGRTRLLRGNRQVPGGSGPALFPPHRSRTADRRSDQGAREAGLGPRDFGPRPVRRDGAGRPAGDARRADCQGCLTRWNTAPSILQAGRCSSPDIAGWWARPSSAACRPKGATWWWPGAT
ncbi:hypothetical protein Lal_00005763 [Lupinus albus]|nr:hypothetical protein Lal_00005763 [Lupinus albus]